jgi:hypothetical protein
MATAFVVFSFAFVFVGAANAASTIGTNFSTTGTLTVTPATDSATSVRFQNTAGTNYFIADSTNRRIGIGAAPGTTFEVQGTASASYFLTGNTIQVGGFASVAYNRFGIDATTHAGTVSNNDDLIVSGGFEVNGSAAFDGLALFSSQVSVSGRFQTSGRFIADTAASHSFFGNLNITKTVVVGSAAASGSGAYVAEFVGATTGTASFYFGGGNSATRGTCLQLKSSTGAWIYMRFYQGATTPTLSAIRCH